MKRVSVQKFLSEVLAEIQELPEGLEPLLLNTIENRQTNIVELIERILKEQFDG